MFLWKFLKWKNIHWSESFRCHFIEPFFQKSSLDSVFQKCDKNFKLLWSKSFMPHLYITTWHASTFPLATPLHCHLPHLYITTCHTAANVRMEQNSIVFVPSPIAHYFSTVATAHCGHRGVPHQLTGQGSPGNWNHTLARWTNWRLAGPCCPAGY